ncbi:hypothetical protein COCOBI_03-6050 [Coccomyxa sp. Obi]|nr:hypothetical protein COCOBI_03-6050 [Coccomyxa sp. Obi]
MHCARLTDESALERARGRLGRPFAEAGDPWLTEARTVAAHGALQRAQAAEREFLTRAFAKVKALELQRTAAIKDVIAAFVVAYRTDLGAVKADTAPLLRVAEQIDGEADLAELTASSAAAAETGAALGARQAEALEAASQELLCSPEIIRQGEMARWVSGSGKWTDCHFVLTRCGFLHWFNNSPPAPADIVPADSLNLSRCQFETGEAPEFNLVEMAPGMFGRSRRLIFRASNVEECCEWAISLREAIRGD